MPALPADSLSTVCALSEALTRPSAKTRVSCFFIKLYWVIVEMGVKVGRYFLNFAIWMLTESAFLLSIIFTCIASNTLIQTIKRTNGDTMSLYFMGVRWRVSIHFT